MIIWKCGDIVFVRKVSKLYKFIRDTFMRDKLKIRVRHNWQEPITYDEYYQEDCTLIYRYEVECIQKYNDANCLISTDINSNKYRPYKLPLIQVGLYNTQLVLTKNKTITIPTYYFQTAIERNSAKLKSINDSRKVQEAIKYQKYKGSYFKQYAKANDIVIWTPVYCSICGKPVEFEFLDDKVLIHNKCICETLNFPLKDITYDEFSLWYTNQVIPHKSVNKYYADVWFKERDGVI